jgi:hypothetical protein
MIQRFALSSPNPAGFDGVVACLPAGEAYMAWHGKGSGIG